ncbi:hypothetical protein [Allorhodopirellula heiligendammensis]|nr:hypothetical protein [Allorhodopirellula heiligendammensis]
MLSHVAATDWPLVIQRYREQFVVMVSLWEWRWLSRGWRWRANHHRGRSRWTLMLSSPTPKSFASVYHQSNAKSPLEKEVRICEPSTRNEVIRDRSGDNECRQHESA